MSNYKPGPGRPKLSTKESGYLMKKMNKAETEAFISESMSVVFYQHFSWNDYIEWARQKGLSREQANVYWKRVWNNVKEKFRMDKDNLIDKHLTHYWNIHRRALENGDLSNARGVLNDIAKLMGLNEPDKVETKGEVKIKFKFNNDDESESTIG
jgi:hypothetical protein